MSVQDKLICVRLVMPRCMFSMQLFLNLINNLKATCLLHLAQAQNVHAAVELAAR